MHVPLCDSFAPLFFIKINFLHHNASKKGVQYFKITSVGSKKFISRIDIGVVVDDDQSEFN